MAAVTARATEEAIESSEAPPSEAPRREERQPASPASSISSWACKLAALPRSEADLVSGMPGRGLMPGRGKQPGGMGKGGIDDDVTDGSEADGRGGAGEGKMAAAWLAEPSVPPRCPGSEAIAGCGTR